MTLNSLVPLLSDELKKPLPGKEGQIGMAPQPVNNTRFNFKHKEDAKLSGVMILLYPVDDAIFFPLMERNKYPGAHSGQISLPGGKKENEDIDLAATARRETSEEMGIPEEDIKFLGHLSEMYIEVSNFRVLPSVGYISKKPVFQEDKREVENLLHVNINDLNDTEIRRSTQKRVRDDLELFIPYFNINDHMVWGATAMILNEFVTIVNRIKK